MTKRVLVVDDEPDFLQSIVARLRLRGFATQGVGGGEEALGALARDPVEVVVLDVKMPGMDGIEALRRIRSEHPDIAVIVLTGHGSHELSETGMGLGAFDYLIKPIRLDDLVERILAALEAPQSENDA